MFFSVAFRIVHNFNIRKIDPVVEAEVSERQRDETGSIISIVANFAKTTFNMYDHSVQKKEDVEQVHCSCVVPA